MDPAVLSYDQSPQQPDLATPQKTQKNQNKNKKKDNSERDFYGNKS